MNSYVITPKNSIEQEALAKFLAHSGLSAKELDEEVKEDLGLLLLMSEGDPNETVPEAEVLKVLRGE